MINRGNQAAPAGLPRRGDAPELRDEDLDTARLVRRFQLWRDTDASQAEESFELLYRRYRERMYLYLLGKLRSPGDADLAASALWERVLTALPAYRPRPSKPFRAWLYTLARNTAVSYLLGGDRLEPRDPRELERLREQVGGDGEPRIETLMGPTGRSDPERPGWLSDQLLRELFDYRLSPLARQVLGLRFMLGLSVLETAEQLERGVSDVKMIQSRALRILRAGLEEAGQAGGSRASRQCMRARTRPLPVLRERRFALWHSLPNIRIS